MLATPELVSISFLALLLFGPDKLPQLAQRIGQGIRDWWLPR